MQEPTANAEQQRLIESGQGALWKKWGPYLSERQWGTVRKDGEAWDFFHMIMPVLVPAFPVTLVTERSQDVSVSTPG